MLIGLAGGVGVGKTSIARELERHSDFIIMSYAQPLKAALTALTGLPMEFFTEIELKEKPLEFGKSPRQMMQLMGTEFVRAMVSEDFWTWRMRQRIESREGCHIIIDDVRFNNEADLVRKMGGRVVHLFRDFECPTLHTKHRSEQAIDQSKDDVVFQCGTLSEFESATSIWKELGLCEF